MRSGVIESPALASLPCLHHGLTTRADGSIGPAVSPQARAVRRAAIVALGGDPANLVIGHQVHGARVAVVGRRERGGAAIPGTDGLVTADAGTVLMVQGADCPLLLLVDASVPVMALVHSGWRGTVAGIGARGVEMMTRLGARPERVRAAVFPGICARCFEVGPEVVAAFAAAFGPQTGAWSAASSGASDRSLLDLHSAIAATLTGAGLDRSAIDLVTGCTACGDQLWSYRASGGGSDRHGLFAVLL